ncbi:MAG: hypothetical protein V3U43_10230 [Pseudomonadales bacterium]
MKLARANFTVQFHRRSKGRRRVRPEPTAPPEKPIPASVQPLDRPQIIPKITRLLVLGHHFERLVREGIVKDYAEIARLTGLSRARITQIVKLTLLAPDIQVEILGLPSAFEGRYPVTERGIRSILTNAEWGEQRRVLKAGCCSLPLSPAL